jgi:hypothetical protein
MRDDFCAFILTHGRPDRVHTYKTLMRSGYTGKVFIVIDDEDKTADQYRARFGDKVLQFCKADVDARIDPCDNFQDHRTILHARNACWDLAQKVGCQYFIELDDDYTSFWLRFKADGTYCSVRIRTTMDEALVSMLQFYESIDAITIAMAQGGDFLGGQQVYNGRLCGNLASLRRKAMNSFILCSEKRFQFRSTFNEDVGTYVTLSRQGTLFFTVMQVQLVQIVTQSNEGGITGLYKTFGTYTKSFSTVMQAPSCVKVSTLGDHRSPHYRIHHKINWHHCAPKILREEWKK